MQRTCVCPGCVSDVYSADAVLACSYRVYESMQQMCVFHEWVPCVQSADAVPGGYAGPNRSSCQHPECVEGVQGTAAARPGVAHQAA